MHAQDIVGGDGVAKCVAARPRKPPIDRTVCRKVGTLRS
jgi:hypothetical protein